MVHTGFLGWHSSSSRPYRTDGVVELTFEIPAAEGSEPPPDRRESSSSPASGESVVFSPEKKSAQTAAKPKLRPERVNWLVTLWLETMRFLFSLLRVESSVICWDFWVGLPPSQPSLGVFLFFKHRSNRRCANRCAFGCAKNPPWCWSLGETTRNRWSEIRDWEVFFCFNFPSNGSHGDELGWSYLHVHGWFWMGFHG